MLYYRLFFIVLFLLLGVAGTGTVVLEYFSGIDVITTKTDFDEQALYLASSFIGAFGLFTAFIMIYLMREKRVSTTDRRQLNSTINFTDRRSNSDRRST